MRDLLVKLLLKLSLQFSRKKWRTARDWTVRVKLFFEGVFFWNKYTIELWNPLTDEKYRMVNQICPNDKEMIELWTTGMMGADFYRSIYLNGNDDERMSKLPGGNQILANIYNKDGRPLLNEIGKWKAAKLEADSIS